ncbi:hypothetical protein GQ44DRAFT_593716, partial [Phaeosphaeriaceae sp. PMI808]
QALYAKAEKLHQQTFKSGKVIGGDEQRYMLTSIGNLESTYRNQGRWKEVEELAVQVMKTRKGVLG